jgi:hypothetical protein
MGKQLQMPATLFFWWLAIEISFLPTMKNHHIDGNTATKSWENTMNKVLISIFVGAILNFAEKIIIQLIAISFHLRTYQDRIDLNKFQSGSLTKLYQFSKERIAMEDQEFDLPSGGPGSGARTPGQLVKDAQKVTMDGVKQFGDIAGKIAGDFTGTFYTRNITNAEAIISRFFLTCFYRPPSCQEHTSAPSHSYPPQLNRRKPSTRSAFIPYLRSRG